MIVATPITRTETRIIVSVGSSAGTQERAAASLLPTLDLFGTYVFRERTGGGGVADDDGSGSGRASSSEPRLFDAGIRAQYTVFSGASNLNRVRAADATIEQRRWLLLDVREALLLETARAYYAVLSAERRAWPRQSRLPPGSRAPARC